MQAGKSALQAKHAWLKQSLELFSGKWKFSILLCPAMTETKHITIKLKPQTMGLHAEPFINALIGFGLTNCDVIEHKVTAG